MLNKKKIIAIITARGGSKGLPDKNIKLLNNKPLIAYTIEAALGSKFIDNVVVSTDSEIIAAAAKEYGAEVPFIRPAVLATDDAKSLDVVLHALDWFENNDVKFDYVCKLQPTSPLRISKDIDKAFQEISNNKYKAVVSVCKANHPPLWINTLPENLSMADFLAENIQNTNRQELPQYYMLNGALYISEVDYLRQAKGFIGKETYAYIMPVERSIDIDTQTDFLFAEYLLKNNL